MPDTIETKLLSQFYQALVFGPRSELLRVIRKAGLEVEDDENLVARLQEAETSVKAFRETN